MKTGRHVFMLLLSLVHRAGTGQGALPGPHRTLDALDRDRAVAQDNTASTICVTKWPRTVRPAAVQKVAFIRSKRLRPRDSGRGDSTDAFGARGSLSTSGAGIPGTLLTDSGTWLARLGVIPRTLLTKLIAKTNTLQLACVSKVPLALYSESLSQ
jgi:hypothetical protein